MSNWERRDVALKIVLPVIVLLFCGMIARYWIQNPPPVARRSRLVAAPVVEVRPAKLTNVQLKVHTQGTVQARTESDLVTEVAGRVLSVADAFRPGPGNLRGKIVVHGAAGAPVLARR